MRLNAKYFCSQIRDEFFPYSTVKIYRRKNKATSGSGSESESKVVPPADTSEYRENEVKIQMLSKNLYSQIFGKDFPKLAPEATTQKYVDELKRHGIEVGTNAALKDVILKLPKLKGNDIEEHFYTIAKEQIEPYTNLVQSLLVDLPEMPAEWSYSSGWTRYDGNTMTKVACPEEDALVFDVEVCMSVGSGPTLACAVGRKHWYSWASPLLVSEISPQATEYKKYSLDDMIPMESDTKFHVKKNRKPRIIIGHNVSFDRARIKEQYCIEENDTRFLDTMSLHVCISGVTSYQRAMLKSKKELDENENEWIAHSSLNNLADVYRLYCGEELSKDPRQVFVSGSLDDVRQDFQNLMKYCASDAVATHKVFRKVFPVFLDRFPHPASLAGMLEIGSAYLPVNSNWNRYIEEANLSYQELDIEMKYQLSRRAEEACHLFHNEQYKRDLWMWDQDWSVQPFKMKKKIEKKSKTNAMESCSNSSNDDDSEEDKLAKKFQHLYESKSLIPIKRPLLPGYPAWYRKLCLKMSSDDWTPGPNNIGSGMQIVPKLLSLCWEGYPLHYIKEYGWGFLVPFEETHPDGITGDIPIEELVKKCPVVDIDIGAGKKQSEMAMNSLWKDVESDISKKDYYRRKRKDKTDGKYTGTGVWCNVILEDCCYFLKLPHKDGISHRVGNPLARDFLNKFSENVLSSEGNVAERVLEIARMLSYWRNNKDRITKQIIVWLPKQYLPKHLRQSDNEYGAIIPQVVVCGTLTRRAMEPTWMTASNAQEERVGSELRSMIQAPAGYRIVGADVDSQELWIASVLGDSHATGIHGATPLGWMTLSGSKASGTDMHSITAKAVGISRDHAKVINYARIYGAGQNFAERLLKQFNPTISDSEARSKAMKMLSLTKGKKYYYLLPEFEEDYQKKGFSTYEALRVAASYGKPVVEVFHKARWTGGTESAMFNRLEDIAERETPATPFLNSRLSRAVEPSKGNEDQFLPTRINWVVQSGAVDFLHLMLVSMRWLMGENIKFCLSFHDEVRYLVRDDLAYKAALAMHVTNLLTRSFCSHRIGLKDLPQSVAFFASVEVDSVLRKESTMDCKTPSNPHGLEAGYGIPKGESLTIHDAIDKAGGNDISSWDWHKEKRKMNPKKSFVKI